MQTEREHPTAEDLIYARWLDFFTRLGFAALVASFLVYTTGIVSPAIPLAELPRYWGLPIAQYVAATGTPTGWGWVLHLGKSDLLNLVGVSILGSVTIVCYVRMLMHYLRVRERAFAAICIAQLLLLILAASGLLQPGR